MYGADTHSGTVKEGVSDAPPVAVPHQPYQNTWPGGRGDQPQCLLCGLHSFSPVSQLSWLKAWFEDFCSI